MTELLNILCRFVSWIYLLSKALLCWIWMDLVERDKRHLTTVPELIKRPRVAAHAFFAVTFHVDDCAIAEYSISDV